MRTNDDWPRQRHGHNYPGSPEEEAPEYLSTGWTPASATPSAARRQDESPTAVTVWNTGVFPTSRVADDPLSTLHLPKVEFAHDRTTTVWRGGLPLHTERSQRRTGRLLSWMALVLLMAAAVGVILWQRDEPGLAVTEVTVRARPTELQCDRSATVVAVVTTNGSAGSIRYRWVRSDGTDSGELRQIVRAGQGEVRLSMYWTFHGRGTQRARAVVDVLTPTAHTASASLTYRCE